MRKPVANKKKQPRSERFYTRYLPKPSRHVVVIRDLNNVLGPLHVHEDDVEFIVAAMNEKVLRDG